MTFISGRTTLLRLRQLATLAFTAATLAACDDDNDGFDLTGPGPGVARGASIFGIDDQNRLVSFGRQNPTRVGAGILSITGLQSGETVVGIDFRANAPLAADRRLFAITTGSRIYTIDTTTGAATAVSTTPFTPGLSGTAFGFDFNPTVDRQRVHSDTEQNLRLNQITGALAAVDTVLAYASGDVNFGVNPAIVATGYTNSVAGATATDLFAIDSDRDVLVFLPSPNSGRLSTRGPLGVNTTTAVGFDIVGAGVMPSPGTAFVTLTSEGDLRSRLYTINLTNGTVTLIGEVNYNRPLVSIAVAP